MSAEHEPSATRRASDLPLPPDFRMFVTRTSFQAMLALGLVENPITKQRSVQPALARMILGDLEMLREKTRGNLDPDEEAYLDKIVGDLRHHVGQLE